MAPIILWSMIAILCVLVIIAVLAFLVLRKKKRPIDYRAWFIIGITWIPIGIAIDNYGLTGLGIVFMIASLLHRKEWEKNKRSWKDMDKNEKKLMAAVMIILLLLVIAGLVFLVLFNKGVIS